MKILFAICLLLSFVLPACNSNHKGEIKTGLLSYLVDISENEDKGIKEIIGFYGGRCEYGFRKQIDTEKGNGTNFWIKFSESPDVDSLQKMPELPASNIAYLFYNNLEEEKKNYKQIETELIFGDGETANFNYTVSQLEKVKNKMLLVNKIVGFIEGKNFDVLKSHLTIDTSIINYDKEAVIAHIQQMEPELGMISKFVPFGFKFTQLDNGREILHISGMLAREKNSHYFSVNLDPNSLKEEIYNFDYKL